MYITRWQDLVGLSVSELRFKSWGRWPLRLAALVSKAPMLSHRFRTLRGMLGHRASNGSENVWYGLMVQLGGLFQARITQQKMKMAYPSSGIYIYIHTLHYITYIHYIYTYIYILLETVDEQEVHLVNLYTDFNAQLWVDNVQMCSIRCGTVQLFCWKMEGNQRPSSQWFREESLKSRGKPNFQTYFNPRFMALTDQWMKKLHELPSWSRPELFPPLKWSRWIGSKELI